MCYLCHACISEKILLYRPGFRGRLKALSKNWDTGFFSDFGTGTLTTAKSGKLSSAIQIKCQNAHIHGCQDVQRALTSTEMSGCTLTY